MSIKLIYPTKSVPTQDLQTQNNLQMQQQLVRVKRVVLNLAADPGGITSELGQILTARHGQQDAGSLLQVQAFCRV